MPKEVKARFSHGKIELLENLDLEEGKEILITVRDVPSEENTTDAFERSIGAWKGQLDIDAFMEELYVSRRSQSHDITL